MDFTKLKERLAVEIHTKSVERRAHVRVRMRIILKIRGTDSNGKSFEELTTTENVSAGGFLCNCTTSLAKDAAIEVFLSAAAERYVGRAKVVRKESPGTAWQRYGFQFQEKTLEWVLQG